MKRRLASLDVLRGADLFFLLALGPVVNAIARAANWEWLNSSMWIFHHVEWEGFAPWDIIMPLFMFMSGITIPFALEHYRRGESTHREALGRILRRVVVLWIFGMMCQGNLLALDPDRIYLYTNTLQAIAVAYAAAAVLYLFTRVRTQIIAAVVLLLGYWAAMEFFAVDGFGLGDYTPDGNLAEGIDRLVLGRWRDHATVENGVVVWDAGYHYTWILSSLTFAVTGISGMLAGHILKSRWEDSRKLKVLFGAGAAMVAVALVWSIWMPIVKIIWTSSMALFAAGISFILMGIAYYLVDCKGYTRQSEWLKVYGMNSIVAYMLAQIFNFRGIANSLLYGLEQYMGDWYQVLLTICHVGTIYLILWVMHRKKIYLKA